MTSADQVTRLLAMVPWLISHDGVGLEEVAETFGITPRQVRADLGILYMCGLPGLMPGDLIEIDMDAVDGRGIVHLSNADYLARPLRFTQDEATTLLLGLQQLAEVATGEVAATVASARDKLRAVAGAQADPADRVQVLVAGADERTRAVLDQAVAGRRRLRLTYDAATRGETTDRVVDPVAVVVRDGYAYLEAWDTGRDAWRSFRLDRIASTALLDEPAAVHEQLPSPEAAWQQRLANGSVATLDVTADAAWIGEYFPVEDVTPLADGPDGAVRVRLRVADAGWLRALLLRLGPSVLAVQPAEYGEGAAEQAAAALALYAEQVRSQP